MTKKMQIYLDDVRYEPDMGAWVVVRNYADFIRVLTGCWDEIGVISLDHDLGEAKTGYDALCVIEQMAHEKGSLTFELFVHSANPVGVALMNRVIRKLYRDNTIYKRFFRTEA